MKAICARHRIIQLKTETSCSFLCEVRAGSFPDSLEVIIAIVRVVASSNLFEMLAIDLLDIILFSHPQLEPLLESTQFVNFKP